MSGRIVTNLEVRVFRRRAIRGLIAQGWAEERVGEAVGAWGDGSIIAWIIAHEDQILAVVKFVMMIISLFAAVSDPAAEAEVRTGFANPAEADAPHPLSL